MLLQSCEEMVAHPNGVRHRSQSRVHRANAREETGVDHIQVIQLMRLAIDVEHRSFGVITEADRPCLVRHTAHINFIFHIEIARD